MNQSWSVIIIAYNEEGTIASVTDQTMDFFIKNDIGLYEIIIVDDGSNDNSENIILNMSEKNNKIKYVRHPVNLGIGQALLSGYKNAKNENVVMIPADGQFRINELDEYKNFPESNYLSFYREETDEYSVYRKLISGLNKFYNSYFLNIEIKDVNWVKAYKTRSLNELDLKLESSLMSSEICAKLSIDGVKAIEIVSVYHKRTAGIARGASYKNLFKAIGELFKLVIVIRKYKSK